MMISSRGARQLSEQPDVLPTKGHLPATDSEFTSICMVPKGVPFMCVARLQGKIHHGRPPPQHPGRGTSAGPLPPIGYGDTPRDWDSPPPQRSNLFLRVWDPRTGGTRLYNLSR